MKTIRNFFNWQTVFALALTFSFVACDDNDEPPHVNHGEEFTLVKLIFTNTADETDVVTAQAVDSDGEGVDELVIEGSIDLKPNTSYKLTFDLKGEDEDLNEEKLKKAEDHQFFFAFSENAFSSPTGDGNIDNAADPINYLDEDANMNPIGLETSWTTAGELQDGTFTVRLQHQDGGVKTATSGADDGENDFELEFVLNISQPIPTEG